jgi:hypothetical protein
MKPKCFAIMPFLESYRNVYVTAIHPAASDAGFDCYRADDAYSPSAIISDIIKSIFEADVIVADLTLANPNVYYELGIAHTVGNKTVMIYEQSTDKLPFDLKTYRVIGYRKDESGINKLKNDIEKVLRSYRSWGSHPTNPVQDFRPIEYAVPLAAEASLERKIEKLNEDLMVLRDDKRRNELRTLILSLPEKELQHLTNLAVKEHFQYTKRDSFLDELRKLRGLGLIRNKDGATIGGIPASGDLKRYLEPTELAAEVLKEIYNLFSV